MYTLHNLHRTSYIEIYKQHNADASYVAYTLRHLHQRVVEHKYQSSSIGKHLLNEHRNVPKDLDRYFSVLKKCMNKFDCSVYEMLLIRELTPSLNVQSDSIQAKLLKINKNN